MEWNTPTPRPTLAMTPVLDFSDALGGQDIELAEEIVQNYNNFDNMAQFDTFYALVTLALLFGGIWSVIRHAKSMG